MDDQRKDHSDPKRPAKRNRSQQLQTYNVPTDDVENTKGHRKEIYDSLISRRLFPEEQKECQKETKERRDLRYIHQHILKENKTRWKKFNMAWIDNKKVYNMVLQIWIIVSKCTRYPIK